MSRRVLITGCGSGFGLALTRHLLAQGDVVVGTERALEGVESRVLAGMPEAADRFSLRVLELRDAASIRAATADLDELDVLVNNAGYALFATQAEADPDAVEDMFSANVFGTMRVTRAVLPALRRSGGAVVQLSSVAGRMVFPESGFYAATKYAVEALSEALFIENCTFGVRVVVVEPGSFDTGFIDRALSESPERREDSPYASLHTRWDTHKFSVLESPQPPQLVAEAIGRALGSGEGFQRVVVGADAERILALRDALSPDGWVQLMGERNGGAAPRELPTPAEVLAEEEPRERWPVAALAADSGHLDHWSAHDEGARALERLRSA